MNRAKYHCKPCDKVVKAQSGACCPVCGEDMTPMGTRWRPGRQGARTRMWDRRQEPAPVPAYWWNQVPWWQERERLHAGQPPRRAGRHRRRAIIEARRGTPVPAWRRP